MKIKMKTNRLLCLSGAALVALGAAGCGGGNHKQMVGDPRVASQPFYTTGLPLVDTTTERQLHNLGHIPGTAGLAPTVIQQPGFSVVQTGVAAKTVKPQMTPGEVIKPPDKTEGSGTSADRLQAPPTQFCTDPNKDADGDFLCDTFEKDPQMKMIYPALDSQLFNGLNAMAITWTDRERDKFFSDTVTLVNRGTLKIEKILHDALETERAILPASPIFGKNKARGLTQVVLADAQRQPLAAKVSRRGTIAESFPGFENAHLDSRNAKASAAGNEPWTYSLVVYEGWLRFPAQARTAELRAAFENRGQDSSGYAVFFAGQPALWGGALRKAADNQKCEKLGERFAEAFPKFFKAIGLRQGSNPMFCDLTKKETTSVAALTQLQSDNYYKITVAIWKFMRGKSGDSFTFALGLRPEGFTDFEPLQQFALPVTALYPKKLADKIRTDAECDSDKNKPCPAFEEKKAEEMAINSNFPPKYLWAQELQSDSIRTDEMMPNTTLQVPNSPTPPDETGGGQGGTETPPPQKVSTENHSGNSNTPNSPSGNTTTGNKDTNPPSQINPKAQFGQFGESAITTVPKADEVKGPCEVDGAFLVCQCGNDIIIRQLDGAPTIISCNYVHTSNQSPTLCGQLTLVDGGGQNLTDGSSTSSFKVSCQDQGYDVLFVKSNNLWSLSQQSPSKK